MFDQSVLSKIKASAIGYASMKSGAAKTMYLPQQTIRLLGYKCCEADFEKKESLSKIILLASENIKGEQEKAHRNSILYNFNRHISLHDLYAELKKKREKLISAL